MFDEREAARKQRPVTVLAVLFGLLLGFAGTAGTQLRVDPNTARIGHGDSLRTAFNLRSSPRSDDDQSDDETAPALVLPPAPRVITEPLSIRPVEIAGWTPAAWAAFDRPLSYRARAPPAA